MVHPKTPQTVRYNYLGQLKEEFDVLERELNDKGVEEGLQEITRRFGVPREVALAAAHRAAKRSGYTMKLFLEQLEQQLKDAKA